MLESHPPRTSIGVGYDHFVYQRIGKARRHGKQERIASLERAASVISADKAQLASLLNAPERVYLRPFNEDVKVSLYTDYMMDGYILRAETKDGLVVQEAISALDILKSK